MLWRIDAVCLRNLALGVTLSLALGACAAPAPAASPTPDTALPTPQPATPAPAPPATPTPLPATAAPATPAPVTPTPEPVEPQGAAVSIIDFGYEPAVLSIATGTQITWTNAGAAPHTVSIQEGESSGVLETGGTFERTFDTVGSFSYVCAIHPAMTGTINVSD